MEIHDAKYALTADDTTESSRLAQLLIAEAGKDTLRPFIKKLGLAEAPFALRAETAA